MLVELAGAKFPTTTTTMQGVQKIIKITKITSHYGACHFGYNLALKSTWIIGYTQLSCQQRLRRAT